MKIFLNLTYGDLNNDIKKLRTYAVTLHSVDPGLEDSIENVISALTKYKYMFRKEYIEHLNKREQLTKSDNRANMYATENMCLKELLDKNGIDWRKLIDGIR